MSKLELLNLKLVLLMTELKLLPQPLFHTPTEFKPDKLNVMNLKPLGKIILQTSKVSYKPVPQSTIS